MALAELLTMSHSGCLFPSSNYHISIIYCCHASKAASVFQESLVVGWLWHSSSRCKLDIGNQPGNPQRESQVTPGMGSLIWLGWTDPCGAAGAESQILAKLPGSHWFQEIFPHEKLHQTLREWAVAYPSPNPTAGNLILQVFQAGAAAFLRCHL